MTWFHRDDREFVVCQKRPCLFICQCVDDRQVFISLSNRMHFTCIRNSMCMQPVFNRPILQIPQCTRQTSHNFVKEKCTCAHFRYKNGALWDMGRVHRGICEIRIFGTQRTVINILYVWQHGYICQPIHEVCFGSQQDQDGSAVAFTVNRHDAYLVINVDKLVMPTIGFRWLILKHRRSLFEFHIF